MSTLATTTPPPETSAAQHVLQQSTGYIIAAALQVEVKLNIPDRLAAAPSASADMATAVGVKEKAL